MDRFRCIPGLGAVKNSPCPALAPREGARADDGCSLGEPGGAGVLLAGNEKVDRLADDSGAAPKAGLSGSGAGGAVEVGESVMIGVSVRASLVSDKGGVKQVK